jgi:hypothetical protein
VKAKKEIIEGLEKCIEVSELFLCTNCPYVNEEDCCETLMKDALELIQSTSQRVLPEIWKESLMGAFEKVE